MKCFRIIDENKGFFPEYRESMRENRSKILRIVERCLHVFIRKRIRRRFNHDRVQSHTGSTRHFRKSFTNGMREKLRTVIPQQTTRFL